jgi:hypothetical protein
MLVSVNRPLSRSKTDQQHPGKNDMSVTFFHRQI